MKRENQPFARMLKLAPVRFVFCRLAPQLDARRSSKMSRPMRLRERLPHILRIELTLCAGLFVCVGSWANAQKATPNKAKTTGTSIRAQLIGSWTLASRESRRANGELEPDPGLSTVPLGVLIYDQSGHVAAQLSRRGRTVAMIAEECQTAATTQGTPDTAQTVLGYDAYFGTYTIDEQSGTVIHHLVAALFPGDIGKDIVRHFKIAGDRLTISFNTTTREGVQVTRTLIWERMK
jgi:hypothetical protein